MLVMKPLIQNTLKKHLQSKFSLLNTCYAAGLKKLEKRLTNCCQRLVLGRDKKCKLFNSLDESS